MEGEILGKSQRMTTQYGIVYLRNIFSLVTLF